MKHILITLVTAKAIEFFESRGVSREARPFYAYLAPPVSHDPLELVNLADKPEHAMKIAELMALLSNVV